MMGNRHSMKVKVSLFSRKTEGFSESYILNPETLFGVG